MRLAGVGYTNGISGVLVKPSTVLQAALLLLATANLGRIPILDLGARQAPLLIADLAVIAVVGVGALATAGARSLRLNDVALAALLFAAIGGVSAVAAVPRFGLSGFELLASLGYLARWSLYFSIYLFVINCVRVGDTESLWAAMEGALMVIALFGIVQSLFLPDFAFVVYPEARATMGWDVQGHRLVSTVLDPNIAGAMIVVVLLVQLARLASGVRVAMWKPLVLFAALVLTLSRSAALSFLVGGLLILVVRGMHRRLLQLAGVVGILLLAFLPRLITFGNQFSKFGLTDESAMARVLNWQRAFELFAENPWFGIGFNTYGFVQDHRGLERLGAASYSAEGGLLFIATMTGLVGLSVYLAMLWLILRKCRRAWNDSRATVEERGLLLGTGASTIAILVNALFINSLLLPFVMEMLWVLWGSTFLIVGAIRQRPGIRQRSQVSLATTLDRP